MGARQARILIFSTYYWPEVSGNAPYVTGAAERLATAGYDVTVVSGFPHYPQWRLPSFARPIAVEWHNDVCIRRRLHYVPSRQSSLTRAVYEGSLFVGGVTALGSRRPDAVIGVSPSLSGGVLALAASRVFRRPFGIVYQDVMGLAAEQSGIGSSAKAVAAVRDLELGVARRAARVGVVADAFQRYFEAGGISPSRCDKLRNWTNRTMPSRTRDEVRRIHGWRNDDYVCLHAGNIGLKQGLDSVIRAAPLLSEHGVRLVIAGDGSDKLRLEQVVASARLSNVQFLPAQPPGEYEALLEAADVLLVNQRSSVLDMSLPSKITSYLAASRPIVAAVAAGSESAAELQRSGGALVVAPGDPCALAAAVGDLKEDPERARAMASAGAAYAARELDGDRVLARYVAFAEALVSGARAPANELPRGGTAVGTEV